MTLRSTPGRARQVVALDYEIAQEQASALGRLGRALETALAALAEFDRNPDRMVGYEPALGQRPRAGAEANDDAETRKTRARLVQQASHALWCFIVQREACGLRDPRPVIRDYGVPAEVQNRMGILTPPGPRPRRRTGT
jgi:hypothetical protein